MFDSWSGHTPRLRFWCPVGVGTGRNPSIFLSYIDSSLPSPLESINVFLGEDFKKSLHTVIDIMGHRWGLSLPYRVNVDPCWACKPFLLFLTSSCHVHFDKLSCVTAGRTKQEWRTVCSRRDWWAQQPWGLGRVQSWVPLTAVYLCAHYSNFLKSKVFIGEVG